MKVHKHKPAMLPWESFTVCGQDFHPLFDIENTTAYRWKDVTCKRCLKRRARKPRKS